MVIVQKLPPVILVGSHVVVDDEADKRPAHILLF